MAGRVWGQPKEVTDDVSNQQLVDEHDTIMKEQDDALDVMYSTMVNTKHIAVEIGRETEESIGLLDSIDDKTNRAQAKIKNATRQTEDVAIQSSTKCLWLLIILLFLGFIVTIIVAFKT